MRILFLDQFGGLGGGQQVLISLVQAVQNIGWKSHVLIPQGKCTEILQNNGATVHHFTEYSFNQGKKNLWDIIKLIYFSFYQFLCHIKVFLRANMLCANGGRMYILCFLASFFCAKPAVYYVHLDLGKAEYTLLEYILRSKRTVAVVAPSYFIQQRLLEHSKKFSDPRVIVLENGLGERFAHIEYVDRFTHHPIQHIGIVGRVHPLKGQDVLLPLAVQFPHIHFHVFGDAAPSEQAYYELLQNKAPANVFFHGWVQDLHAKMREIPLQICLVPSRAFEASSSTQARCFEASPLVTLEMTMLSCVVMVRRVGALEYQAHTLGFPSFHTDTELSQHLTNMLLCSGEELALSVKNIQANILSNHSPIAFQKRIQAFFSSLEK